MADGVAGGVVLPIAGGLSAPGDPALLPARSASGEPWGAGEPGDASGDVVDGAAPDRRAEAPGSRPNGSPATARVVPRMRMRGCRFGKVVLFPAPCCENTSWFRTLRKNRFSGAFSELVAGVRYTQLGVNAQAGRSCQLGKVEPTRFEATRPGWYELLERVIPFGMTNLVDPQAASHAVHRNAERGFRPVALPECPHITGRPLLYRGPVPELCLS